MPRMRLDDPARALNAASPCQCKHSALQRQLFQRHAIGIHTQDRALFVPVAQHDARAGITAGLHGVDGRAMGVAVDQPVQPVTHEGGFHFGRRDVGDGLQARLVALPEFCMPRLTSRARLLRERTRAASGWARNCA